MFTLVLRLLAVFLMTVWFSAQAVAENPSPRLINTDSGLTIVYPRVSALDEKRAQVRDAERRGALASNRLNDCRNSCLEDCLSSDSKSCSRNGCDQGQCQSDRQEHEAYQRAVAQLTAGVQRAAEEGMATAETPGADSATSSSASESTANIESMLPFVIDIDEAKSALNSAQTAFSQRSYHLNKCRESCLANCRSSGSSSCSNTACDQGQCKTARQEYDRTGRALSHYRQNVKNLQTAQTNRANKAMKGGTQSALKQVRDSRKNMSLYGWMGVGTTALLAYMSYTCCNNIPGGGAGDAGSGAATNVSANGGAPASTGTTGSNSGGATDINTWVKNQGAKLDYLPKKEESFKKIWAYLPERFASVCAKPFQWAVPYASAVEGAATEILPCSNIWCGIYIAGTVAAGLQTYKIFQQKNKLRNIESALCEKNSETKACSGDSEENAQQMMAETPYCRENPANCQATQCAIDPSSPNCDARFAARQDMAQRLSSLYGAWPDGQNPFGTCDQTPEGPVCSSPVRNAGQFELSPEEQALLDEAMGQHLSQQTAYLNHKGAEPLGGGATAFSNHLKRAENNIPSAYNEHLAQFTAEPAGFTAGPGESLRPQSGRALAQGSKSRGSAGLLSREMDKKLQEYYQDGRGENDPHQGRFTSFGPGNTPVGVKSDNLFLMQHRLYRRLSLGETFLSHRPKAGSQGSR